nr:hypothetical protein [Tanacetum cinerariifolium]
STPGRLARASGLRQDPCDRRRRQRPCDRHGADFRHHPARTGHARPGRPRHRVRLDGPGGRCDGSGACARPGAWRPEAVEPDGRRWRPPAHPRPRPGLPR